MQSLAWARSMKVTPQLSLSLIFLFLVPLNLSSLEMESSSWLGWQAIGVPRDLSQKIQGELLDLGVQDFLSATTAQVEIQDFSSMERISLDHLAGRLHPSDPRLDPYLLNVQQLFYPLDRPDLEYLYIPSKSFTKEVGALIRRFEKKDQLFFPKTDLFYTLGRLFFLLLASVLLWLRYPKQRMMILLLGIGAGVMLLISQGGLYLSAGFTVILGGFWFSRKKAQWNGESLKREWIWLGALIVFMVFSLVIEIREVGLFLLWLSFALGTIGLTAFALKMRKKKNSQRIHPLFIPKTFALRKSKIFTPRILGQWVSLALIMGLPFFFITRNSIENNSSIPLYFPDFTGEPWSLSALENLLQNELKTKLPGPATYIAHRIFQEGFLWGASFSIPSEGSTLGFKEYTRKNGQMVEENRSIQIYNDEWLMKQLQSLPQNDPGSLFLSQPSPFRMVIRISQTPVQYEVVPVILVLILLLSLAIGLSLKRKSRRANQSPLWKYELRSDQSA